MKLLIFLCALVLALPARAANEVAIANMQGWCECVMSGGVCQVTNATPAKGARIFTAAGPINAAPYNALRADPLMCQRGVKACSAEWGGETCGAFRLMFRQEAMVCLRPGEPKSLQPP